jgi:hypothetical protein
MAAAVANNGNGRRMLLVFYVVGSLQVGFAKG